ncbi:hypothetical protein [Xanthomonas campestris]|uniref:hypothetical protein n=1 Tax=Xanthomonas campestris TaxID=339 RepID=UPI002ECFEEB0|nr:hypothetical protein LLE68_003485 [Xanthomonas campestris pv. barbareae]
MPLAQRSRLGDSCGFAWRFKDVIAAKKDPPLAGLLTTAGLHALPQAAMQGHKM